MLIIKVQYKESNTVAYFCFLFILRHYILMDSHARIGTAVKPAQLRVV